MRDENPAINFRIKERINTKLFIDLRAALWIQKGAGKYNWWRKDGKIVGAKEQK